MEEYKITIDTKETYSADDLKELISVIENFMKNKDMEYSFVEAYRYEKEFDEYFWVA